MLRAGEARGGGGPGNVRMDQEVWVWKAQSEIGKMITGGTYNTMGLIYCSWGSVAHRPLPSCNAVEHTHSGGGTRWWAGWGVSGFP